MKFAMQPLVMNITPGTVIDGKYRIESLLGEGGMGAVYRAVQVSIERQVAVKVLHASLAHSPEVIRRFHREARAAGSIGSDYICEVTDLGEIETGAPYLVMPLLQGASLAQVIHDDGPIAVVRGTDIIGQTLVGLTAAHSRGIVHRDLKPDNIYITRVGDRSDFVKILDFGISKMLHQSADGGLTSTGTVLGTPYYMAPEQARGQKDLDNRVDVYAAGVILYEMLTGEIPFRGDNYNEIMLKVIFEPFPTPRQLNEKIPASVEAVILKAMSRDMVDRYPSTEAMRNALRNAMIATGASPTRGLTEQHTAVSGDAPFVAQSFSTPAGRTKKISEDNIETISAELLPSTRRSMEVLKKRPAILIAAAVAIIALFIILAVAFSGNTGADEPASVPLSAPQPVSEKQPLHEKNEQALKPEQSEKQARVPELKPIKEIPEEAVAPVTRKRTKTARKPVKKAPASRKKIVSVPHTDKSQEKKKTIKGRHGTKIDTEW